jgi:hypothetical protein
MRPEFLSANAPKQNMLVMDSLLMLVIRLGMQLLASLLSLSVHLNDLKAVGVVSVVGVVGIIGVIGMYHKYSRID